jgi:hypothetical protein
VPVVDSTEPRFDSSNERLDGQLSLEKGLVGFHVKQFESGDNLFSFRGDAFELYEHHDVFGGVINQYGLDLVS